MKTTRSRISTSNYSSASIPSTGKQGLFPLLESYTIARTQQQRRWFGRKGARMGHHLETLDELSHRESRQEAKERRKKKKDRSGKHGDEESSASDPPSNLEEDVQLHDDGTDLHFHEPRTEEESPVLPDPLKVKERMMKVVDALNDSFQSIRGAEPTPELFDVISVQAYGERTPLSSVAQVVIASPTLVNITCFDPQLAPDVRNAVRDSLELNPQLQEDGLVRVPMPRPSAETRKKTVKQLGKLAETGRTRIRRIRRSAMDVVKEGKDGKLKGISKDDAFRVAKEIEEVTQQVSKTLNECVADKQETVMAV